MLCTLGHGSRHVGFQGWQLVTLHCCAVHGAAQPVRINPFSGKPCDTTDINRFRTYRSMDLSLHQVWNPKTNPADRQHARDSNSNGNTCAESRNSLGRGAFHESSAFHGSSPNEYTRPIVYRHSEYLCALTLTLNISSRPNVLYFCVPSAGLGRWRFSVRPLLD